jgi:hypothetical protein
MRLGKCKAQTANLSDFKRSFFLAKFSAFSLWAIRIIKRPERIGFREFHIENCMDLYIFFSGRIRKVNLSYWKECLLLQFGWFYSFYRQQQIFDRYLEVKHAIQIEPTMTESKLFSTSGSFSEQPTQEKPFSLVTYDLFHRFLYSDKENRPLVDVELI